MQYFYGSADMVVAPVLSPIDYTKTSMADKLVWLPPTQSAGAALGSQNQNLSAAAPVGWVERGTQRIHYLTGKQQTEGAMLQKLYPLAVVPVFIKSGAVIPSIPLIAGDLVGTAQKQVSSRPPIYFFLLFFSENIRLTFQLAPPHTMPYGFVHFFFS